MPVRVDLLRVGDQIVEHVLHATPAAEVAEAPQEVAKVEPRPMRNTTKSPSISTVIRRPAISATAHPDSVAPVFDRHRTPARPGPVSTVGRYTLGVGLKVVRYRQAGDAEGP